MVQYAEKWSNPQLKMFLSKSIGRKMPKYNNTLDPNQIVEDVSLSASESDDQQRFRVINEYYELSDMELADK